MLNEKLVVKKYMRSKNTTFKIKSEYELYVMCYIFDKYKSRACFFFICYNYLPSITKISILIKRCLQLRELFVKLSSKRRGIVNKIQTIASKIIIF